jgi:acyl-CoA dehydrogenase
VRLSETLDSLERATQWLLTQPQQDAALAGATPYLRLFATAAGGTLLAQEALAAARNASDGGADAAARIAVARFFAENFAVTAGGLERSIVEGADSVTGADAALA